MKILEICTFPPNGGYMGGVVSMVDSYLKSKPFFQSFGQTLELFSAQQHFVTKNSKLNNLLFFATQRLDLKKHLSINKYDVVHIHTSREFVFLKDIFLLKLVNQTYGIPVVLTIHVGDVDTVYNRISFFKRRSIKYLNRYCQKVVFLSENMKNDFIKEGLLEEKTIVLYNFHTFNNLKFPKNSGNNLNLLFVGAIHREKGIVELLQALSQCSLDYHLNVCGQLTDASIADEVDQLKESLGEKVTFWGYVKGDDKKSIFEFADILILPSYHEGLPLVIMEALGAGCSIISTKVGAIPEVLGNENCLWVEVGSVNDITKALQLISDRTRLYNMQQANYKLGKEYTLEGHLAKLSYIYQKCF